MSRRAPARSNQKARVAARRERSRAEIIECARKWLVSRGPGQFTLDDVAGELGITKPAVYYYFPNRDALVRAAGIEGFLAHGRAILAAVREADDGTAALHAVTTTFVEHYRDRLDEFRLDFVWPQIYPDPQEVRAQILPLMNQLTTEVAEKLRSGDKTISPMRARRLCMLAWINGVGLVSALSITDANGTSLAHSTDSLLGDMTAMFGSS